MKICYHCLSEVKQEEIIKTRFGHTNVDESLTGLLHALLCESCYDELSDLVRKYVGYHQGKCNKNCEVINVMIKKPDEVTVSLNISPQNLGFNLNGKWTLDDKQRAAAWEMYVELVTRISVAELKPDEGLLREALASLYTLYGTTRQLLRKYGPSISQPKGKGKYSFGYLAVVILNCVLRPVLAKWHPLLEDYEASRKEGVSRLEHERKWEKAQELRDVLNETRDILIPYVDLLAEVATVPSLTEITKACRQQ